MKIFFHWLPHDAYLFIDEVNSVFPTTMRPAELAKLDYPGGLDNATADKRPSTINEAFEMHRHYNWDICVTTPDIKLVHQCIRLSAEAGILHTNKGFIGLKGVYLEKMHSASNDGKNVSNVLSREVFKVKKYVFNLYESTATSQTRDTQAGKNIFLSVPVLGFASLFLLTIFYLASKGTPTTFQDNITSETGSEVVSSSSQNGFNLDTVSIDNTVHNNVSNVVQEVLPVTKKQDFLSDYEIYYVGNIKVNEVDNYQLQLVQNKKSLTVDSDILSKLGYELVTLGECLAQLKLDTMIRLVTCPLTSSEISKNHSISEGFTTESLSPI